MATAAAEREPKERELKLSPEQERISDLLDDLSAGDTLNVYRAEIDPTNGRLGQMVQVWRIVDFKGIDNLEGHVFEVACRNHWPKSDLVLRLYRPGNRGVVKERRMSVDPPPASPNESTNGHTSGKDPIELLKQARELFGEKGDPALMTALVNALAKPAGASDGKITEAISSVINTALPLVLKLLDRPAPDPTAGLDKLVGMLDKIGAFQRPENPPPAANGHGLVGQLAELKAVMELVSQFGGGAAEPRSTLVQVAEILGPQLGPIVDRLTDTTNRALDYAMMRHRLPGVPGGAPQITAPPVVSAPAQPSPMQLFVGQLHEAIKRDDHAFFPQLAATIATQIPGGLGFVEQVRGGKHEEESALTILGAAGIADVRDPATRTYALTFLHWLRSDTAGELLAEIQQHIADAQAQPSPLTAPNIPAEGEIAKCERCGTEYKFQSLAAYESDAKMCEEATAGEMCGGILRLVDGDPA